MEERDVYDEEVHTEHINSINSTNYELFNKMSDILVNFCIVFPLLQKADNR